MDTQNFRSLQEAYLEVYTSQEELDEGREGGRFEYNQRHGRPLIDPASSQRRSEKETLGGGTYERGPKRLPKSKRKYDRQVLSGVRAASDQEKQRARKRMGISEDHELDEALTGERYRKVMKKPGGTAYSRKVSEDPSKRATRGGRGGESDFGAGDRGAGNKAARRAGTYQEEGYDVYDIILSHLLDEGYAETPEAAEVIMVNMSEEWREEIMEGMTMKDFKANRQKNKRRAASADAAKRGHVGKEWYNSGRKYSPDDAKRMRSNLDDEERRTRHRSAVEPDNESDDNFSADKTKNPKKLRKQRAMGEHG